MAHHPCTVINVAGFKSALGRAISSAGYIHLRLFRYASVEVVAEGLAITACSDIQGTFTEILSTGWI